MSRTPAVLLAVLLAGGCAEPPRPEPSHHRRASASGDAALEAGGDARLDAGCPLPFEGCCDGETLWWCQQGKLKSLDCKSRPHCGWSDNKLYDCNTSGASDPTGMTAKYCFLLGVKVPSSDGGRSEAGSGCREVPSEGCCSGQTLYFCEAGQLKSLGCGLNPACGWRVNGQVYDCGTEGKPDPSGRFPQQCPAGLDAQPGIFDLRIEDRSVERQSDGGDAKAPKGCSCELTGASAAGGLPLAGLIFLLAWIRSDRRTAPSGARCRAGCRRRRSRGEARTD